MTRLGNSESQYQTAAELESKDKGCIQKSAGQSQDRAKQPLGRATETQGVAVCHGKVSSKTFPEPDMSFLSLPGPVATLSRDSGLFSSYLWGKYWKFTFDFSSPPLHISHIRTRRSMYINKKLKDPLSTLHAIRYFLTNSQKRNMIYSHLMIYLSSNKTTIYLFWIPVHQIL